MGAEVTGQSGRSVRVATYALMAVAYALCEVAAYPDGRPSRFGVAFGIGVFSAAIALSYLLPRSAGQSQPSIRLSLLLGLVLVLPLLVEPLLREHAGVGFPLEMQLVNSLRTLGLVLAGLSVWRHFRRLAAVVALFLALFGSAMGDQDAIPYLLALFAIVGGVWLILEHMVGQTTARATSAGVLTNQVQLRLPYREAIVFGVLATAAAGLVFAGPKQVMLTLGEWMPTSGGTGETDPFARYGVGDGPEEVAGDDARAAGMVETDQMIEDNRNSLIDAVNDMYGPPHKPPKERERMVAAGLMQVIENHGKLPDNRTPSRDFDTKRKGPQSGRKPGSRGARAVFEVEGRTPLHIRSLVYEEYDGEASRWIQGEAPAHIRLSAEGSDDWMRVTQLRSTGDWYADDDRHRLKAANMQDNLVPTPALLTRVRIAQVNRADYYTWDYEDVLTLAGRKTTPPGVVVTTDCRTLDSSELPPSAFPKADLNHGVAPQFGEIPAGIRREIERIAHAWAGSVPRGWEQIAQVVEHLRSEYTLDPNAVPPPDHPAPVLWFLTESRRGPDYLFATAAALLLRSLDYPTRVCLGYYASPDAYDSETDHTPVRVTDLHTWPEVLLQDGNWLVVEPTPGYETLPPLKPWRERILEALTLAVAWSQRNAGVLIVSAVFMVLGIRFRRRLLDAAYTGLWWLRPGRTWREVVLRTAKLVERRARYAGRPRADCQTLGKWLNDMAHDRPGRELTEFARCAEWAAYGSGLPAPTGEAELRDLCVRVLAEWTVGRLTPQRIGAGRDT